MHMQTPSPREIAGLSEAWSQIASFTAAVDAGLGAWLADTHRIGVTEYRALDHLHRTPDKELRVSDLAQRVGLNQSSTTRLISRLETKGLARRDLCPDDGRGVYAVITERGEQLLREAAGPYASRIRDLLDAAAGTHPSTGAASLARALAQVGALIPT